MGASVKCQTAHYQAKLSKLEVQERFTCRYSSCYFKVLSGVCACMCLLHMSGKVYMQASGSNLGNYCKQFFTEQKSEVYQL